jgi:hypothetical protein
MQAVEAIGAKMCAVCKVSHCKGNLITRRLDAIDGRIAGFDFTLISQFCKRLVSSFSPDLAYFLKISRNSFEFLFLCVLFISSVFLSVRLVSFDRHRHVI